MKEINLKIDPKVDEVFDNYPEPVRDKMLFLKELVKETAEETEGIDLMEITLKWGEPSFVTKKGSTLRMDWKDKKSDQYAMYFQCTSRLVETFQFVFGDTFNYEGKREIVFKLDEEIPVEELKKCIKATLRYHQVKNDLTLGI